VNYKRKSRCRFFLLMRSRTPPISSEFRGGGGVETPLGTPLPLVYVNDVIIKLFLHAINNTSFVMTKVSEMR